MATATRRCLLAGILAFAAGTAQAHDLWLFPAVAERAGEPVTLEMRVGSEFPRNEPPGPDPAKLADAWVIGPDGKRGALERAGFDDGAGFLKLTPRVEGLYMAGVQTTPKLIKLPAAKFNEYLVQDGMPALFLQRSMERALGRAGKERYSKSPKVIFPVGHATSGDVTKPAGATLEIVPHRAPGELHVGDTLAVQVLFHGAPLADANLGWALPGDGAGVSGTMRADAHGEAMIPISRLGLMTIRLTHMTHPKQKDYEWESFWTSLTFQAGEPPVVASKTP